MGLVVLVMAGFGYWQYATSLRQTDRLLDAFADLGAGDYDRSVSLRGGAEWEQIGDGFNDLASTLRAREAALRERTQRLEVMYRVLRHNLRNQLTVVLTYAEVVADVADDDRVAGAGRSILDAGRTLANLSDRVRQIETALEADQSPTRVEVVGVVSDVVTDLRESYPTVELETSLPDAAPAVALPSLRLAVENVCENACEHNDADDPRVDVSVSTVSRSPAEAVADDAPTPVHSGFASRSPTTVPASPNRNAERSARAERPPSNTRAASASG
ncbi:HAMP domain-containing protein [Halogeometricum sp. CBA1124]|uniref:HAMP domain-containing protein n=1 Tax=Halogeometricum sp. CBA1124 TaxID=2668071 RepID=UPI00142AF1BF|nr:HAMP domain-containing protein [Halogeometricum sp. CBA1124]MUV59227.1 HAMP domain-containing protein [Halogeometricum sp. CBA1124]